MSVNESTSAPGQLTQAIFWVKGTLVRYAGTWQALNGITWYDADSSRLREIADHLSEHCAADFYPTPEAERALIHRTFGDAIAEDMGQPHEVDIDVVAVLDALAPTEAGS